jgi:ABC-type glutathione transport system ATPase component
MWAWQNLGGDAAVLIAQFVICTTILAIIELDLFKGLSNFSFKKIPAADTTLNLDEDVIKEEVRVAANQNEVIRVADFRKAYTSLLGEPFLAVERISFGLDYGECFALLGVNGAGKSTTFKSLTAETPPSQGKISIDSFDIEKEFSKAR